MSLPAIMPSRLQRVVADTEFGVNFKSFDELCQSVSETTWAKSFELNASIIKALIVEHKTITQTENPDSIVVDDSIAEVDSAEDIVKIVKTFDEGGKGKKQCSNCGKFSGVRTSICVCGHEFVSKSATDKDIVKIVKTFDEGGKGKKQCSNCGKFSGVRTAICVCGHEFVSKSKLNYEDEHEDVKEQNVEASATMEIPKPVRQTNGYKLRIMAPAGSCPHRLDITSDATIEQWAEKCRKTFMDRDGSWLTINALRSFVREFHVSFLSGSRGENPEYRRVCNTLESLYARD